MKSLYSQTQLTPNLAHRKRASGSPRQPQFARSTIWSTRAIGIGTTITWILGSLSIAYYPGGNHFDNQQVGYSFTRNWLCDSFSLWGFNGQQNLVGSLLATTAMLVFVWLALFPLWGFLLNQWIPSRLYKCFLITLAMVSACGTSLLPLSYHFESTLSHAWFVWGSIIPVLPVTMLFVLNGWRLRLFPKWLLVLASSVVLTIIADLGVWIVRLVLGGPPTILEPLLMKVALVLVLALVTSLSFFPKFQTAQVSRSHPPLESVISVGADEPRRQRKKDRIQAGFVRS